MAMIGFASQDDEPEEGSMVGPKLGTWWVTSKIDTRWCKNGRGYGLITCGGPGEIGAWLTYCDEQFGKRPEDLSCGFMKD